jgi:hypothetical protein
MDAAQLVDIRIRQKHLSAQVTFAASLFRSPRTACGKMCPITRSMKAWNQSSAPPLDILFSIFLSTFSPGGATPSGSLT